MENICTCESEREGLQDGSKTSYVVCQKRPEGKAGGDRVKDAEIFVRRIDKTRSESILEKQCRQNS